MADRAPLSTEPYKGVRDFYPADWAKLQHIFEVARDVLTVHGFEEYQASPLERAELYERKTSEEIVSQQTYTFTDRGERKVTLRPEMTPTLARMVAAKRGELVFPVRWFSIGNRFRYERMQKGRHREFYQIDVDIVGIEGAEAEGEAVVIASRLLMALGATEKDFTIKLNSRILLNAAATASGLSEEEASAYLALLDRKEKMPAEEFQTERAAFRKKGKDPLEVIESHEDAATEEAYQSLMHLIRAFNARGMRNVEYSPTTVRGFLYYTGLVFEVFDTDPENSRSLMGGGRYDGLVSLFGGAPLPAVGFAVGDAVLGEFLASRGLLPEIQTAPSLFIATPSAADLAHAQDLADELRSEGISVIVNSSQKKGVGDQIKEADRRKVPYVIVYGANEAKSGTFKVKELASGKETKVKRKKAAKFFFG